MKKEKIMKKLCEMTVEEVQKLAQAQLDLAGGNILTEQWIPSINATSAYIIGRTYLIRTVTMIQVGRVVWVGDRELILEDAAWIPDTGRFHEALRDPDKLVEVEPAELPCIVNLGAVVDAWAWPHKLPRRAK